MGSHPDELAKSLVIGSIIEVDGENFVVALDSKLDQLERKLGNETYIISQFGTIVKVISSGRCIYGRVGKLRLRVEYEKEQGIDSKANPDHLVAEVTAFGEGDWTEDKDDPTGWSHSFYRGIRTFPSPSQKVALTPKEEVSLIVGSDTDEMVEIGEHSGTSGVPCNANINQMLGQHTAILGSTGTGKSCTVASVLHNIVERGAKKKKAAWSPIIIVLDPHNEYGRAFKGMHTRLSTDEGSLFLPHWLMNLDETVALIFGRSKHISTQDINVVKRSLWQIRERAAQAIKVRVSDITIDSPIPYTLEVLKENLESWRVTKDTEQERSAYDSVMGLVNVLQRDSRLNFLTQDWGQGKADPIGDVLSQFVGDGPPVRIVDLSGVPDEVAGLTSGVIARMLFNFKLWQSGEEREKQPILLVCEEAHRYVPDRGEAQYASAQEAIRRLAKEGRKYGIGIMLVSQRPSELEATVLSQCNSWLIHRITNETDLSQIRAILPDTVKEMAKRVTELRRQEAFFVGQAATMPSRVTISTLKKDQLPRSTDVDFNLGWQNSYPTREAIEKIAKRWRIQQRTPMERAPEGPSLESS